MRYRLTLEERERAARNNRARYYANPAFRLAQINKARARRGSPPLTSLDEMGECGGCACVGRDEQGRFA